MAQTLNADASVAFRVIRVFTPFALAYFLSYLYRTVNAVIADELTASVGVTAAELGLLTSAYLIAFGAFQLPLGPLLDRYGPRRVNAALLIIAAAGAAVFAMGESTLGLALGRALIGLGVSACLMAALTANVAWWPADRLPLVNGLFLAAGGLGAVFATTPVQALLTLTDWRGVFFGLAGLTLAAAATLFLVAPDRAAPAGARPASMGELLAGMGRIYRSASFWRMAPAYALVQGVFIAYLGLWAGPWLRDVEGLDRGGVAAHLQIIAIAMVVGFAGFGMAADALRRVGLRPFTVMSVGMVAALVMQAALLLDAPLPPALVWGLYSVTASSSVMVYALISREFPADMAGRVNTAANFMMFVVAFVIQSGAGVVIGAFPAPAPGAYAVEGHRAALAILLAVQTVSMAWMLWPRRR